MAGTSQATIERLVIEGAKKAFFTHEEATGGLGLWTAPESYIQAKVFDALATAESGFVTMESSQKQFKDWEAGKFDKRTNRMRSGQKFDLVFWKQNETPKAVIEIKKVWNSAESAKADIKRMRDFSNSCKEGEKIKSYLLVYTSGIDGESFSKRLSKISKIPGVSLVNDSDGCQPSKDETYFWGFGLFKV